MLFFAIKGERYISGHLGDGLIAVLKDNFLYPISLPDNGEYINTTYFTTSKNYISHFRVIRGEIDSTKAIFLMSDGAAESLFQKKEQKLAPALMTISQWIDSYNTEEVDKALLQNMQEHFTKRTNDDCSLLILQKKTDIHRSYTVDSEK